MSTPLLGLALPTDGTTNWGTLVNTSITALLDSAVAGTTSLTLDSDVTLSTTVEAANQARQAVLLCTGARTAIRRIVAPAQSKTYVVINATTGGFGVTVSGVGPTTGVTVPAGKAFLVAWNGTDFVATKTAAVDLNSNDVTGTLPLANGGTGQTTAQAAINALAGGTTSGQYLRGNGTNVVLSAIQAADVPTLNQNTTGNAATATNVAGGAANRIPVQSGANTTTFIAAPTTASTYLSWTGSAFAWSNVTPGSTFAGDITVNTLTVGKGPNNPTGNTTFGFQAAAAATSTAIQQTAIGFRALASNTNTPTVGLEDEGSTAVGYRALEFSNSTSSFAANTAVGASALRAVTTGGANTAIGSSAAASVTTGNSTVAVGWKAGESGNGAFVAVGAEALRYATDRAAGSVAVGNSSLINSSSFSGSVFNRWNTAVGQSALSSLDSANSGVAGSTNTALGYSAGSSLVSGSNNLILGASAQASSTNVSNEITLGNSSITTLRCQVTSITSLSDERDKHSIEDLPVGLDLIKQLRPRRFKWDKRDWYFDEIDQEDGTVQRVEVPKDGSRAKNDWNEGFIAQEAKAALQAAGADWFPLVYESNPEKLEMSSGKLIPVLVKAIQELTARIEALENK